jgi:hypothetical protein
VRAGVIFINGKLAERPGGPAQPEQPDNGRECPVTSDAAPVSRQIAARYFEMWNTGICRQA